MEQQAVGSIWDSFRSTHIPVALLQINVPDEDVPSSICTVEVGRFWSAGVTGVSANIVWGNLMMGVCLSFMFFIGLFCENGSI